MKPNQPTSVSAGARHWSAAISLAVVVLVAGCASSAGIRPQASALEPQAVGLAPTASSAQAVPTEWWRNWGDAHLSSVIEQALQAQPSLKVAQARLRRAQAATAGEAAADGL